MKITVNPQFPFCVYFHICDGDIFYVGSGSFSRAFNFRDRSFRWEKARAGRHVTVMIAEVFATCEEAVEREYEHIRGLEPIANESGNPTPWKIHDIRAGRPPEWRNQKRPIKAFPSGKTYRNASDAAFNENLSPATVLTHLRNGTVVKKSGQYFKWLDECL